MTDTERQLQNALDANPTDSLLREVLADYLDEQDDPRGPGYRYLGRKGLRALQIEMLDSKRKLWILGSDSNPGMYMREWFERYRECLLPEELLKRLPFNLKCDHPVWRYFPTRIEAENAIASVFLPSDVEVYR